MSADKNRILVVEDDSIFRNYLYQVLKYEFEVTAVEGPRQALESFNGQSFDLMISDLRMPEMDGRELVEKVHREIDPNLMVIIITAFEGDWPIDNALASHVFRYLRKGAFLPSELKQNVTKAIEMRGSIVRLEEYRVKEDSPDQIFVDIFNNSPDALFVSDLKGRVVAVNRGFEILTGYSRAELEQLNLFEVVTDGGEAYLKNALNDQAQVPLHLNIKTRTGDQCHVELWVSAVENIRDQKVIFGAVRTRQHSLEKERSDREYMDYLEGQLKAKDRELAEARVRFDKMASYSHDIVVWLNDVWKCDYISPGFSRVLGYAAQDVVGRLLPWKQALHPDDQYMMDELYDAVAQGHGSYSTPLVRLYAQDRRLVYCSVEVFIHYDRQNSFVGLEVVAEDITQRKIAEQELRKANQKLQEFNDRLSDNVGRKIRELKESQERYQHIVEDSSDVIMSIDTDGRVTYMNRRGLEALGITNEEVCGRSYREFLSDEQSDEKIRAIRSMVQESQTPEVVDIMVDTSGGQRTWRVTLETLNTSTSSEIICVARDITGEIAKSKRLKLLANIEHYNVDAIIGLDNERRVISWNEGARMMFGWQENEIIGKTAFLIIPEDERETADRLLDQVKRKGFVKDLETRRQTKDGRILNVAITITNLKDSKGESFGFSTIIKDVTEQKKMEKALIQSERLAATGKLSASIAHEINNPLYGIKSCLQHVVNSEGKNVDLQFARLALKETDRIADLIRNMKTFYMPTEGNLEHTDINQLLRDVLVFNKKYLEENRVRLEFVKGATLYAECVADQIKQVFINMITNAVEAMPDGGLLTVATHAGEDKSVVVDFKDEGVGIADEDVAHIFDMFYTKKPKVKGVGLGLSVSYGIITRHGGSIDVRRRPSGGTCFTVTLPVHASADKKEFKLDLG